jgi:hypothetical protein
MRGPLIATLAAIVALSGCAYPPPRAPIETPTSEVSPTGAADPTPAATAASPVAPETSASPLAAAPAPPAPPQATASTAPSNPPPAARSPPTAPPASPEKPTPAKPPVAAATPAAPPVAAPTPAAAPATAPTPVQPASPPLDLAGLEQRLRETRAIGVFTKLSLKNQVDDLLDQFRRLYGGQIKVPLTDLRQRYEHLLLEVVTLLQDADQPLANAITSSREAIWGILTDPKTFATI